MKLNIGTLCATAVFAFTAVSASAQEAPSSDGGDPTFSIALTWVFGKGPAVGLKAFSTDREGDAALTLGIDYLFNSGAWRPNIGAAYIDDDAFLDLSFGFGAQEFDFGVGIGPIDSSSDSAQSLPPLQVSPD